MRSVSSSREVVMDFFLGSFFLLLRNNLIVLASGLISIVS